MDPKLVSSKEDYEVAYIAKKFDMARREVRRIMMECGKNGNPCRSRKVIYKAIREINTPTEESLNIK